MKKKIIAAFGVLLLSCSMLSGCADQKTKQEAVITETAPVSETAPAEETAAVTEAPSVQEEAAAVLSDGTYTADFDTDSSMFHVSEACDGKGTLTVENGKMTIHISLMSKKIINLYPGLAAEAENDAANMLIPTEDTVTYSDETTEAVYGYDVPVPALDEEFDLALLGTKGTWYDHKVTVSNPEPLKDDGQTEADIQLEDGSYTVELTLEGGSGRAEILSPATVVVSQGAVMAMLQWSSPNYDYMIADGQKYLPQNTEGDSVFEIPIQIFDEPIDVIGDTVAMSKPHEVEYTLTFHSDTVKTAE